MERSIAKSSNMNERVTSASRSTRRLVSPTMGGEVYNNSLIIEIESLLLRLTVC